MESRFGSTARTCPNDFSTAPKVTTNSTRPFFSGTWRWNPTPSITNELRGGFNFSPTRFVSSENFGSLLVANASLVFDNPMNLQRSQGRYTDTYSLQDNASYTRGRHNIQFGFQGQMTRVAPFDDAGNDPGLFDGDWNG